MVECGVDEVDLMPLLDLITIIEQFTDSLADSLAQVWGSSAATDAALKQVLSGLLQF